MYIVKYDFVDLQDNNYAYKAGDTYPREGYIPNEDRINELITAANKQGRELIMVVKEPGNKAEITEEKKNPKKPVDGAINKPAQKDNKPKK